MSDLWLLVLVIALVGTLPRLVEVIFAYVTQYKTKTKLIRGVERDETVELDKEVIALLNRPPAVTTGATRNSMAITVIVVLGVSLAYLLIKNADSPAVSNILSMLAGLISAIIGFYFAGRVPKEEEKPTGGEPRQAPGSPGAGSVEEPVDSAK